MLAKDISIYAANSTEVFWDKGGQACALDVTSKYMVITVQCVMPITGRFLGIFQQSTQPPYGIEICELYVHGKGKVIIYKVYSMINIQNPYSVRFIKGSRNGLEYQHICIFVRCFH